jgi:hypothetical protein
MNSGKFLAVFFLVALITNNTPAWDNQGHEAVVAVALAIDPDLEPRVDAILKKLPTSSKWKTLKATGLKNPNPFETQKENPTEWVKTLATDPERAATFPDWARDYRGYVSSKYDKIHFFNMDYDDPNSTRFIDTPNALTVLDGFEKDLKKPTKSARAWALTWVFHIVGDLHQPLHCIARGLPTDPTKSDHGGNGVHFKSDTLHHFWDHLPDKQASHGVDLYAHALMLKKNQFTPAQRAAFEAKAADLNPEHWIREGRDLIFSIGYPDDHKVTDYEIKAHDIADAQILLAGARLAKILEQNLP